MCLFLNLLAIQWHWDIEKRINEENAYFSLIIIIYRFRANVKAFNSFWFNFNMQYDKGPGFIL